MNEAPEALKRGGDLTSGEIFCGVCCWNTFSLVFGQAGLLGISTLAVFTALLSSNGSIYLAIVGEYGDDQDMGAYSLLSLRMVPSSR